MLFRDTVEVTITVTEVDEPPIFTAASTTANVVSVTFDETTGIDDVDDDAAQSAGDDAEIAIALSTYAANDAEDTLQ